MTYFEKKRIFDKEYAKSLEWHITASEIREKSRQTTRENYGVDNPFAAKEIIEQIKIAQYRELWS